MKSRTAFDAVTDILKGKEDRPVKKYVWVENPELSIDDPKHFIILTEYEDVTDKESDGQSL